jgi:hypothetical protein
LYDVQLLQPELWEYPASFDRDYQTGDWRLVTVFRVYALAILDRPGIDRGPLISLAWASYFLILQCVVHGLNPQFSVFWMLFAAAVGLLLYRKDKGRTATDYVRGFKMWQRVLMILVLVVCALLLPQVKITV